VKLYDLFGYREYMYMHDQGYIRENAHPTLDLKIINYTEKAQYDNEWNNVTTQCRGLIVSSDGTVIARPFDKFLNYGQNEADKLLMDFPVVVTDKMDGSLGILWSYKGEQGIATRGSFTSEQAVHATALWKEKYNFAVAPMWTYMFEIVYPSNRIVLDYGDMDELVLLGVRDIEEGSVLLPNDVYTWRGPKTQTFSYETLREALAAPQRPNAEGFVVYFPDLDYRIKVKQDDYVALHKIVTGLTERRVWENLMEGQSLTDLLELIPDEWHEWLRDTYKKLRMDFLVIKTRVESDYRQLVYALNKDFGRENWSRKEFARLATSGEWGDYPGMMFSMLDGKDIDSAIWKLIKPSAE
jgi:RNA ligase